MLCVQQALDLAAGSRTCHTSSGPTHPVKVSRDSPVSLHCYSFVEREGGKQSEAIRTRCLFFCHNIQHGSSVTTWMSPAGVLLRLRIVCENDIAEIVGIAPKSLPSKLSVIKEKIWNQVL